MMVENETPLRLWGRWTLANGLAELVGLSTVAAVGYGLVLWLGASTRTTTVLGLAALMIALGTIEGVVVGVAQWFVLHRCLKDLCARTWVGATALAAFVAWTLGMIPSTIMNLRADVPATAQPPSRSSVLLLAAAMGAALGVVLALPQWFVLRRHLSLAGWWIPANAAAWMVGMPIIFAGIGWIHDTNSVAVALPGLAAVLLGAGVAVGAIHGLVLISLLNRPGSWRMQW